MQVRSYPDSEYSCDGEIQRRVSQRAAFRDRWFVRILILIAGSFGAVVIGAYFGMHAVAWGFAVFFGVSLLVLFALAAYTPRPKCSRCGSRMKLRYVSRQRGPGEDLFMVCPPCKIYADAHLSQE